MKQLSKYVVYLFIFGSLLFVCGRQPEREYPITPVEFTNVDITGGFWHPRMETNRRVTIPTDFEKCEETGRIDNFARAAGLMPGEHQGKRYDDSDVFKVIEGAAYSLTLQPDPALETYLDSVITLIAGAQEEDGYLYTMRTVGPLSDAAGETRWSYLQHSHELYNVGHMYEAAVAYYRATGKRSLLDVAIKNADLIDSVFGPEKKRDVPGHEEIEIGLIKLYRITGEKRYLDLAKFFLEERGRAHGRELYGRYCQDHAPVIEQQEAVGHAVRAGYLYSGMADAAAMTGDSAYVRALNRIWENVVSRQLYLTGGIGAQHGGEAFGDAYQLPNATAYNETCAAIANMLWNQRMFLLHGDAKYIDVLERVLYNGYLAGVSMDGDKFFYVNPLEADGEYPFNHGTATRQPWFSTACCPTNVVRFMPSLPGYIYAIQDDRLYVNLYLENTGAINMSGTPVTITQATRYPWDGSIRITVEPEAPADLELCLRIPGWARNQPVPSDLYRYAGASEMEAELRVNGEPQPLRLEKGYVRIRRTWRAGDEVELSLPMPVRRVRSHPAVEENAGHVAVERGPLVYCAESIDNTGDVRRLTLAENAGLTTELREDLLGGITMIHGTGVRADNRSRRLNVRLLPYYAWSHRGVSAMAVWLEQL
ncbi:MAG TPA: glycoside hydrolase family 127 protein [bacterium]|nr:glycoside hydrolase family 127 protein [bacterium]